MNEKAITELGYAQRAGDLRYVAQEALEALAIIALSYREAIDRNDTPPYVYAQQTLGRLGVDLERCVEHVEQSLEALGWRDDPRQGR